MNETERLTAFVATIPGKVAEIIRRHSHTVEGERALARAAHDLIELGRKIEGEGPAASDYRGGFDDGFEHGFEAGRLWEAKHPGTLPPGHPK